MRIAPPLALVGALLLSGCVVGPNYAGPPAVAQGAVSAPAFRRAETASSAAPVAHWWTALNDAELDRLEEAALAAGPDLEVAKARILQSRANLATARANRLPSIQASAAYLRTKGATSVLTGGAATASGANGVATTGSGGGGDLELTNIGGVATWEPDLFGGKARAVEGARARAEAARDDLDAMKVTLTDEVAQAYVTLRDLQARLALSRHDADIQARTLQLSEKRRAGGTASDLDVERLNSQLQATRADAAPLQAQITEQIERLALLTGAEPGSLDAVLAPPRSVPLPPASVVVGDPATLLRSRPDIRAAERRIAAANAVIGQRTADLFPKVTLFGNIGFGSTNGSDLLSGDSFTYALAPFLQWKPFDFGRTQASIALARGQTAEAVADYKRTVLVALNDAETMLSRYARRRERVAGLMQVQASAERFSKMTDLRVAGGTAAVIDQLDAESRRSGAAGAVQQAQVQLTLDYVNLQKSLGLGWANSSFLGPTVRCLQ